ncbi:hypothetical protein VPH35_027109 [Triticum aestivum]
MESSHQSNPRRKNRNNNRVAPPESLWRLIEQLKVEKEKLRESESLEATSERVNSLREEIRTLRLKLFGGQGGTRGMPEQPPSPRESSSMAGQSARQSQLVSCTPHDHENEIGQSRRGSKKGKRGGRAGAAATPARPQHDSAMDQQRVQDQRHHKNVDVSGGDGDDDMKKEMDRGKSAQQIAREEEEMAFASYHRSWESNWGASGRSFFEDTTTVSPMHFTHCTPGCDPGDAAIAGATLQIFTIKLVEIKGGLKWPLSVYGVVAARDCVDHSRNLLFSCDRWRSQKLGQDIRMLDPFLRLIGPSRAIVFTNDVYFEIALKVKGKTLSQDIALISGRRHYSGGLACLSPSRTYKVTGGKVTYSTHAPSMEVVMLASRGRTMPKGAHGYLRLSRYVVFVELEGSLNVVIQVYSESGDITAQGEICFMPKACNVSQETCFLGDRGPKVEVEITVAWSLLVSNMRHLMMNGMDFDELKEVLSGLGV